jgi:hypothetical protein
MNVGSGGDDDEVMVDINTTPLIDVMLVLLIMFIITIPIQTHAVKMNMPVPGRRRRRRRRRRSSASMSTSTAPSAGTARSWPTVPSSSRGWPRWRRMADQPESTCAPTSW